MFSDHMVLQRERPLPVWGTAPAGEKVTVSFSGETATAITQEEGRWQVMLSPKAASTSPQTLTIQGSKRADDIVIKDVLVGDVWLGTGQSNMDWDLSGTDRRADIEAMPAARFKHIRLYKTPQQISDVPLHDTGGAWTEATQQEIMRFSATLFYFGEELNKHLPDVPLGLVRSSVGATNLYCWIPNELRDKDPSASYLRNWWSKALLNWSPEKQAQRDAELQAYEDKVAELKQQKQPIPQSLKKPGELLGPKWSRRPSGLYNGMIAPLQPFAIRGQIWYQGEWDAKHDWVQHYHDMFVAYAKSYRAAWVEASGNDASGDFPIYIVQLPAREAQDGRYWPYMREVQDRLATSVPNSGVILTYDTNDPHELHPREKTPVGQRLAWLALGREYMLRDKGWFGPRLINAQPSGGSIKLTFNPGDEGMKSSDGQPLRYFEVAGDDGVYHAAEAEIQGNAVMVSSSAVKHPRTARYAFIPSPDHPNFYNTAGLPAFPFRTDTLPIPGYK